MSATYLGSYSDRLWNVRSLNPGVYIPGSCTLQTPTGPAVLPDVLDQRRTSTQRRELTMQNYETGKYLGVVDEHTALGDQKYNGLLLSVQRRSANGITVSANYTLSKCTGHPTQGGTHAERQLRATSNPNNIDYDYGAVRLGPPPPVQPDGERRDAGVRQRGRCARWRRTGACRASSAPTRARRSR